MNPTRKYEGLPGFAIDPITGKYYPVAVDIKAVFGSGSKRSKLGCPSPKSMNACFGSSTKRSKPSCSSSKKVSAVHAIQAVKCRKVDNGVRKELFKVPSETWQKWSEFAKNSKVQTSPGIQKSLGKLLPSKSNSDEFAKKLSESKKEVPSKGKLDQAERSQSKSQEVGYSFKPPVTPQLRFNVKVDNETCAKTPDPLESNIDEFLKLEQLCKTPKITSESPVSSVCNLFKNKMLLNQEKETEHIMEKPMTRKEIIAEIRKMNKSCEELSEEISQKRKAIMALVDKLDEDYEASVANVIEKDEEKENSSRRRSLRLQNRNSEDISNHSSQVILSPVILKSGDLRKSALTKSLVNKCRQNQTESPRTQKALNMYNLTRNKCSALLTPKLSRSQLVESSASFSLRNNLSVKVQKQCLMLQESPAPK